MAMLKGKVFVLLNIAWSALLFFLFACDILVSLNFYACFIQLDLLPEMWR